MENNRVVYVLGSPHHAGNTATLAAEVLRGVQDAGGEITRFCIDDMRIWPCQGCEACKQTGVCVQEDDMSRLYQALDRSRRLVLGTPIYFDHVSAQTKIFIDRLYAYLGPNLENHFPAGYRAALVVTWGDANPDMYTGVIDWLKGRLTSYFGVDVVAAIRAADFGHLSEPHKSRLLQQAYAAGVALMNQGRPASEGI